MGNELEVTVRDNGKGYSPADQGKRPTLGFQLMEMLAKQLRGKLSIFNENGLIVKMRFPIMQVLLVLLLVLGGATAHGQTAVASADSTRMVIFHHRKTALDASTRHTLDSLAALLNNRPDVCLQALLREVAPCFPSHRTRLPGFPRIDNICSYIAARKNDSTDRLRFSFDNSRNSDTVLLAVSTIPDPVVVLPHLNLRHR